MTYRLTKQYAGYPPIESLILAASFAAAAVAGNVPFNGEVVTAYDPVWGGGELIWGRAGGAIRQYGLCVYTPVWDSTNKTYTPNWTECPNTANLGREVGVAQRALAAGDYGWFLVTGNTPINGTVSVAADTTFGITAAGQVGANSAGKQILGGRVVTAATNTVVKAGRGLSGDTIINVPDTDGWFLGGYLSGTNVGAAALISEIDPMGRWVRASVANSGVVGSNVTQTANNATIFYNVARLNRSYAQGAIT
jgi:hypothetical protein